MAALTLLCPPAWGVASGAEAVDPALEVSFSGTIGPALTPVTEQALPMDLLVRNDSATPVADVSVVLSLPPSLQVGHTYGEPEGCATTPSSISCEVGTLGPSEWFAVPLTFVAEVAGTYRFEAEATATGIDVPVTRAVDTVVADEESDLVGLDDRWWREEHIRGYDIFHHFRTDGPTSASLFSIDGAFPEGTQLTPGSFTLFGVVPAPEGAPDLCTTTATGFSCDGLFSDSIGAGVVVQYHVQLPVETFQVLEATATITGRNDPDPSDNTATFTLWPPSEDLYVTLEGDGGLVASGETFEQESRIHNRGSIAAENVVLVLEVPEGWAVGLPSGPAEPGRSCSLAPGGRSVRCAWPSVDPTPTEWPNAGLPVTVPVTPPAVGRGEGVVRLTVTTDTAEIARFPRSVSVDYEFVPSGADLVVTSASHTPAHPMVGDRVAISFRFRNASPDRLAVGAAFTITNPTGMAVFPATGRVLNGPREGQHLTCERSPEPRNEVCRPWFGHLGPDDEVEVVFEAEYESAGSFTSVATASQRSTEAAPGNESVALAVVAEPVSVDLALTATVPDGPFFVGLPFTGTYRIHNHSDRPATNVTLTAVGADTETVSAALGWFGLPCADGPGVCTIPYLRAGGSAFVVVATRPLSAGSSSTRFSLTSDEPDHDPASNTVDLTREAVEPQPK